VLGARMVMLRPPQRTVISPPLTSKSPRRAPSVDVTDIHCFGVEGLFAMAHLPAESAALSLTAIRVRREIYPPGRVSVDKLGRSWAGRP
jgi:hypothetical protein